MVLEVGIEMRRGREIGQTIFSHLSSLVYFILTLSDLVINFKPVFSYKGRVRFACISSNADIQLKVCSKLKSPSKCLLP